MSDLLTLLEARGYRPRRVSSAYGGEYVSPCPGPCKGEGEDRFHIWPKRENDNGKCVGRYWCRHCDASGDTLQFLMDIDGLSFPDACAELGIASTGKGRSWTRHRKTPVMPVARDDFWEPRAYPDPSPRWQEQAAILLADCRDRLERDAEAQAWLAARGISMPLARAYGLGYNRSSRGGDRYRPLEQWGLPAPEKADGKPGRLWLPQGWVIPSFGPDGRIIQLRIRRRDQDLAAFAPDTKYVLVRGSSMATMLLHADTAWFWAVVESGFDAILLAGLFGSRLGVATTWNSSARPDARAHRILADAAPILGALDYDAAGDAQQRWWQARYPQYRRLPALPGGAKDPGDAHAMGVDLYAWIVDALPRPTRIALGVGAGNSPAAVGAAAKRRGSDGTATTTGSAHEADRLGVAAPPEQARDPESSFPPRVWFLPVPAARRPVWLTDDRDAWDALAARGKPVFSTNELRRLQAALPERDGPERDAAIRAVIDVKEVFGGYIRAGRAGKGERA